MKPMGLTCARYAPAMRPFCAHDALSPNRWCHSAPAVRPVLAHYAPLPEIDWPTLFVFVFRESIFFFIFLAVATVEALAAGAPL